MKAEFVEDRVIDVTPETPKPTIRQRIRRASASSRALVRKAWVATDIDDRLFFLGLLLVGTGLYSIKPTTAAIVVGALLILAVRPVRRWF